MEKVLNELPVATLTFLAGVVFIVIGMINGDTSTSQAFEYLWQLGAGSAAIGYVRNQAGKGLRK